MRIIGRTIACASGIKSQGLEGENCSFGSSTKLRYVFSGMRRAYHVEVDSPSQVYRFKSHPCFGLDFIK